MGVSVSRTPPEVCAPQSGPAGAAAPVTFGLVGLALLAAPATSPPSNRGTNEETVALRATVARVRDAIEGNVLHVVGPLRGDQQRGIVSGTASPVNQPASPIVKRSAAFRRWSPGWVRPF